MKKRARIMILLCLSCFAFSCVGSPPEGPKSSGTPEAASPAPDPKAALPEHDDCFIESDWVENSMGPRTITRAIFEDRRGDIWLASWEGIIRYDGKAFTNVTNRDGLRRFRAFSFFEDSRGALWIGTVGAGVYRYDGKSFTNFTTLDGLSGDRVGCIFEDSKGVIWVGSDRGLNRFDGKSFRSFTTADGLLHNDINSVAEDATGRLWIGTRGEASWFDGMTFTRVTQGDGAPFTNVRSVLTDRRGGIWLGGADGLWLFDGRSFTQFRDDFVGSLYEDRAGMLWLSAGVKGSYVMSLYRGDGAAPPAVSSFELIHAEEGQVFGITEDSRGGIWFGTENGAIRYADSSIEDFRAGRH